MWPASRLKDATAITLREEVIGLMAKSNCSWGFNGAPGAKVCYPELAAGGFKAQGRWRKPGLAPGFSKKGYLDHVIFWLRCFVVRYLFALVSCNQL